VFSVDGGAIVTALVDRWRSEGTMVDMDGAETLRREK
jgi:hypothetical protein